MDEPACENILQGTSLGLLTLKTQGEWLWKLWVLAFHVFDEASLIFLNTGPL